MGGGYYSGKGGDGGGKGGGGFYTGKGGGGGGKPAAAAGGRLPGDELPGGLRRKLEALSYPELDAANLSGQAYCKIVLWLEEEKIRLYDKIDRKPLRDFNKGWFTHVEAYAKDLGVPAEGLGEKAIDVKLRVLNALANLAVHDIYRDKVEADELTVAKATASAMDGSEKRRLQPLVPAVNRLLEVYELPPLPEAAEDADTVAALRCVHTRVCPPREDGQGTPLDVDRLPTGLQIDSAEVRRAAAVLRLLHGLELQQLQVNINHVINELQSLTADPKTDARLGRVGR